MRSRPTAVVAAARRALRPPADLSARVRWCFLLFGLFFVVTFLPQLIASPRPPALRLLAVCVLLGLGAWWIRCYRTGRFPWPGLLLEFAAFVLCGVVPDDAFKSLGLLYIAVNFRTLYGRLGGALLYAGFAIATFGLTVVLAADLGAENRLPQFLQTIPGVPVLAVIANLVSMASLRSERAAARERTLSRSGLALALAGDEDEVRRVGAGAVTELLSGVAGARIQVVHGPIPPVPTRGDHVLSVALRTRDGEIGQVVVETDEVVSAEVRDALDVLTMQIALALENVTLTASLRHQALHDGLTGLANRRHAELRLEQGVQQRPEGLAVVLADLDGFKAVNDAYGHGAGDDLLAVLARRIRGHVGERGLVARLGGDEFVVLLDGCSDLDECLAVAQGLVDVVSAPVELAKATVRVGLSAGLSAGRRGATVASLLRDADLAMYAAKRAGGGRVRVHGRPDPAELPQQGRRRRGTAATARAGD
jgi:diguanylate cyclase (GGDEF)-like protein